MKNCSSPALYERQPGESSPAFATFQAYLEMGPERSVRAVARKCNKSYTLVGRWSGRWHWQKRLEVQDAHDAALLEQAKRTVAESKAVEWARREEELREAEWQHRTALIAKAEQMMKMPIVRRETREQEGADGKTEKITVIRPTRWEFGTAARL